VPQQLSFLDRSFPGWYQHALCERLLMLFVSIATSVPAVAAVEPVPEPAPEPAVLSISLNTRKHPDLLHFRREYIRSMSNMPPLSCLVGGG